MADWAYVSARFAAFLSNLRLTQQQLDDGRTKKRGVVACLNRSYYASDSDYEHSFLVGSWGKDTAIRPPRDVDIYFELPATVLSRFALNVGNKQSAILQEVRRILQGTYWDTDIRGDGPVVVVKFASYSVEVVPAFALEGARYWVCDTKLGGSYKETTPWHEVVYLDAVDDRNAKNLRPLVRMLKAWQSCCSVPLKSFQLELLAAEYIDQSDWGKIGLVTYDFLVRDFFKYIAARPSAYVSAPGTGDLIWLGDAWKSRAQSAAERASRACEYEKDNFMHLAGNEWQKVFGTDIPGSV